MLPSRHDDLGRHKSDKMVNNREVFRLRNKAWVKCKWFEVLVGDIVKVMNDEMIPADLFLISSSNDANEAYVETAELDGYAHVLILMSAAKASLTPRLPTLVKPT